MFRAFAIWLTATVIGIALVVLLPEDMLGDGALFSFSSRHGPSASDSLGVFTVLAGWLVFLRAVWLNRRKLQPRWLAVSLGVGATASGGGCIAAVVANLDGWAAGLAVGAMALQAMLCLTAPRRGSNHDIDAHISNEG